MESIVEKHGEDLEQPESLDSCRSRDYSISFQQINPVTVRVRKLSVATRPRRRKKKAHESKAILQETSFDLPSGSLMAIIGGSGSGKTTLLNVLADRSSSSNLEKTGEISFNGSALDKVRNAYVIQQDILSALLTARETLQFATELRLPDITTRQERSKLVEEVILELGLKDCADTMVGDSRHKGLSGGEKRRLSIGIQLLSNPSMLFLDEPTTGLDAHSAFLLIKTLKQLARKGRTIIISIHQPRSDIFFLFDRLCILSQGQTLYNDEVSKALPYFSSLGFDVPESVNPADFLIDITSVDIRTNKAEQEGRKRLAELSSNWNSHQKLNDIHVDVNDLEHTVREKPPFLREVVVLIRRNKLLTVRDSITLISLVGESIFMGIVCGWVFFKPGNDLKGTRSTVGALYSANGLQGYLMLLFETYRLSSSDIKVFDRERADNCVSIPGFLLSRRVSKLFTEDIIVTLLFSVITYFMFGLNPTATQFFTYWANILLVHNVSMTSAMFAVAISRNFANASLIANMNYTLQSFACGYFVNARTLPVYVRWTKYIAFVWYGFGCLVSNEFTGFYGDCPIADVSDPSCNAYIGKYIIESYGFWENWRTVPLIVLFGWVIVFYVFAGIFLKLNKVDVSLSKQISSTMSYEEHDHQDELIETTDSGRIDISLNEIFLKVKVKRRKEEKIILNNVSANFKAGSLNAIMGPSGSGKSSLLNLISGRISSDIISRYSACGEIVFNKKDKVSTKMVNEICSYVSQDDDHLLSSLSVRETLSLGADLRIKNATKQQKSRIVEDIIGKLGLRACADTLIGSEFIKGISGGEKRRVSIAIQLLNNPKILLLDEPTSGLDSFTASSILEILQTLADEGKTVILTIHQPRSDLFTRFGQVLLLAKGGVVGYNGPQSNLVEHFAALGYPCPELTNSADHVLDLISVNNQTLEKETVSKQRIEGLLSSWKEHEPAFDTSNLNDISKQQFNKRFGQFIRQPASFTSAYYACLKQFILITWRNKQVFFARFSNVVGLGAILALFIAELKNDYESIQNRLGLVQQTTALYFCGMLNNLTSYPDQRDYFYHEFDDHVYGTLPFFLSYTTVEIPFEILSSFMYACFTVLAAGLPRTGKVFFSMTYVSMLIISCGESLGIITLTLFKEAGFSVNTVSIFLSIGTFMAGIMSLQMDRVLKGINYISPLKYGISLLLNISFPDDLHFTCTEATKGADGECLFKTGSDVLENYGLKASYQKYYGVLLAVAIGYRLVAYLVLKLKLYKFDLNVFNKSNHMV